MLKVLIIAEGQAAKTLHNTLSQMPNTQILDTVSPQGFIENTNYNKPDFLAVSNNAMLELVHNNTSVTRTRVKAVTHQGIRLVPIENIYYFQAEHKYVTAVHTKGHLLIEDSLNSLEKEFSALFVRIHRKTLVAKQQIAMLEKDAKGRFFIRLRDGDELLAVSRRQLPQVRKVLLCL